MPAALLPSLRYASVAVASLLLTWLLLPMQTSAFLPNTALLYVLLVVLAGRLLGRGPAIVAAFACFLLYAYVFVPPFFLPTVAEAQYLLAALVMLAVALLVGQLAASLRDTAGQIQAREAQARALYELARSLAATLTHQEVEATTLRFLGDAIPGCQAGIIDPDNGSATPPLSKDVLNRLKDDRQTLITRAHECDADRLLVPLHASKDMHALLVCDLPAGQTATPATRELLETIASVTAVALERTHFADAARESEVRHSTEVLRNSILSALSHDLRTPLTGLIGMAETLASDKISPERQRSLLWTLRRQAMDINRQVTNLLDMARLRSGTVELNEAWQPVEEIIGVTLQQVKTQWRDREITLDIEAGLPPIYVDGVLMERLLWNLMENAIKYSPKDTPVELSVRMRYERVVISVCDWGPGLPVEDKKETEELFGMFRRGRQESSIPGVGLGLAIARAIAEAHGGEIVAENRLGGGASFSLWMPAVRCRYLEDMKGMEEMDSLDDAGDDENAHEADR